MRRREPREEINCGPDEKLEPNGRQDTFALKKVNPVKDPETLTLKTPEM